MSDSSATGRDGKVWVDEAAGGERYDDRSLGRGGTGGTIPSSAPSALVASWATRSLNDVTSLE
jgi:hypothetical protein